MKDVVTHALGHAHSMLNVTFTLIHLDVLVASATKEIHFLVVQKLFQVRSEYQKKIYHFEAHFT